MRRNKIGGDAGMKEYQFYGWEQARVRAVIDQYEGIHTPLDLYDALSEIWCADTCAPRMRDQWTPENKTLGHHRVSGAGHLWRRGVRNTQAGWKFSLL